MKKVLLIAAMGLAGFAATSVQAESAFVTGTGTAAADLNLRVIIPRVLFLGVGTGAAALGASNATVDRITYDYTTNATAIGGGAAAAVITNSGAFTPANSVPVRVVGNNGQIVITATNPVSLLSGTDAIPFTQFSAVSGDVTLAHPALGGGTASPTLNTGSTKVTTRNAVWTYTYANTVTPPSGTYDGQIVYTASMP